MNFHRPLLGLVIACHVFAATSQVAAQDWPQWRGPNRDNTVKGFIAPKTWPQELTKKWNTKVGQGDAGPVLIGDKVFVFGRQDNHETTICLDAKSGDILWQEKYQAESVTGPPGSHPGPRSTPVIAEGKLCTLGVGGILSCLDAMSGKVLWRKDSSEFPKQWPQAYTSMSPVIVDGMCIAHLGGGGNGAIIAYDLTTGAEKWRAAGEGPCYGSPIVVTVDGVKQLATQTEKSVVGVAVADGKQLWSIPFANMQNSGTPVADGNTLFYSGQGKGTIAVKIVKQGDAFEVEPFWTRSTPSPRYSTPVLKDGYLYGATSTGNIYCLDAKTGEVTWTDTTRRADPAHILDVGPVLLALTGNSELAVIEPNGKEFKELAKYNVAEGQTWSYPIVAGNRLFVKDKDSLTLWTIE